MTRILTEAAQTARVRIRTGLSFTGLVYQGSHVEVAFTDGTRDRFELVVGADGTHSAVRGMIHHGIAPAHTNVWMSFRIVLDDAPDGTAGFYTLAGGLGMLATVRLPGNRLYLAAGMEMENRRSEQAEAV